MFFSIWDVGSSVEISYDSGGDLEFSKYLEDIGLENKKDIDRSEFVILPLYTMYVNYILCNLMYTFCLFLLKIWNWWVKKSWRCIFLMSNRNSDLSIVEKQKNSQKEIELEEEILEIFDKKYKNGLLLFSAQLYHGCIIKKEKKKLKFRGERSKFLYFQ